MTINGLPLHPLIVHLVVVLTPTAGILALVYSLVPRWRWWARWPFVVASVGGAVVTYVAVLAGHSLKNQRHLSGALMAKHQMWGTRLEIAMVVLAVVALAAWWVLPFSNPLEGRADRDERVGVLTKPLVVVLPIVGIAVIVFVYITGEAGARLVYGS